MTRIDAFPMPGTHEALDAFSDVKWFSTFHLASGYHQVQVCSKNVQQTVFSSPFGLFEFKRMPMGLCNAQGTYSVSERVLSGERDFPSRGCVLNILWFLPAHWKRIWCCRKWCSQAWTSQSNAQTFQMSPYEKEGWIFGLHNPGRGNTTCIYKTEAACDAVHGHLDHPIPYWPNITLTRWIIYKTHTLTHHCDRCGQVLCPKPGFTGTVFLPLVLRH